MAASGPDLNLLVALQALLEEVNVTRAGARLDMGQSSMSAVLARLRTQYHDELLVQVGRNLELTPLARQLLPQVQLALPMIERSLGLEKAFDPATSKRSFTFKLSDYALAELRDALHEIAQQAPGVRFEFEDLPQMPLDINQDLLHSDFLIAMPGIGIDGEHVGLLHDHYVLLVDRQHPALANDRISLDDFLAYPHVRTDVRHRLYTPYHLRLQQLGIEPDYRVTAASSLVLPAIVAGTELIAGVPSRLIAHTEPNVGVVTVPTPFELVEIRERLMWHASRAQDPGHIWLREELLAEWKRRQSGAMATTP